jgi:hypothetical protein
MLSRLAGSGGDGGGEGGIAGGFFNCEKQIPFRRRGFRFGFRRIFSSFQKRTSEPPYYIHFSWIGNIFLSGV